MDQCGLNDGAEEDKYTVDHGCSKCERRKDQNRERYCLPVSHDGESKRSFNKVNFGSGVLRADQIDPFGSTVDYEDGRFRVKAGYIVRQKELRDASLEEIKELRDLHNRWKDGPGAAELGEVIKNKVKLLNGGVLPPSPKTPIPHLVVPLPLMSCARTAARSSEVTFVRTGGARAGS